MTKRISAAALALLMLGIAHADTFPSPLEVDDYLADASDLVGKPVAIHGVTMCLSLNLCYLYKTDLQSMSGVPYNAQGFSRDNKKKLLDCNIFTNKCYVVIHGIGPSTDGLTIIKAESIDWVSQ